MALMKQMAQGRQTPEQRSSMGAGLPPRGHFETLYFWLSRWLEFSAQRAPEIHIVLQITRAALDKTTLLVHNYLTWEPDFIFTYKPKVFSIPFYYTPNFPKMLPPHKSREGGQSPKQTVVSHYVKSCHPRQHHPWRLYHLVQHTFMRLSSRHHTFVILHTEASIYLLHYVFLTSQLSSYYAYCLL